MKDLEAEVRRERTWKEKTSRPWETINNWYYLNNLGKMLPDHEQCILCICEGNLVLRFFTLEGVFKSLRVALTESNHPPEPEVIQAQSELVREPDEKEPEEEETSEFTKLEVVLKDLRNSIAQMNHHLEPKAKASTEEKTTGNNALSTSEPQYN